MTEKSDAHDANSERQKWLAILAGATPEELAAAMRQLDHVEIDAIELRVPESGLALVTGRVGATGSPFGVGEMTVTRCVVQIGAHMGVGYVRGRDRERAKNVALADALLQGDRKHEVMATVIEPLSAAKAQRVSQHRATVETSRVRFLTMVRGD